MPVPESGTFCGLPAALSVTRSAPARGPATVGVKVTDTRQLAPAATGAPHALAAEKSPVADTEVIVSGWFPVFATVTVFGAPGENRPWLANASDEGVTLTVVVEGGGFL